MLIVTDAFMPSEGDSYALHPALDVWKKSLQSYGQTWFVSDKKNPLEVYAHLVKKSPAQLLAEKGNIQAQQYWVASPYHGQLTRSSVRVLPESMLTWQLKDAQWVCDTLNPLLQDDGMCLHMVGSALLLASEKVLDVSPVSFAAIAGHALPSNHPEGEHGGYLMRLLAEIQMQLYQSACMRRRESNEYDIHGLWFWGDCHTDLAQGKTMPIATRNAYLHSVVDGRNAKVMITESDDLEQLLGCRTSLPKCILLMGEGHVALLKKNWLPQFRKSVWQAKDVQTEKACWQTIEKMIRKL